jgi:glutamyl-tRNA reductase
VSRVLADAAQMQTAELAPQLYRLNDDAALRHMFLVVSSLDSPVIGEPEVTGQVKDSHELARGMGMTGMQLEQALQAGYRVAKRVRTETAVGERPVSIAAAAVRVAQDVHGDLRRCSGLLLAGGEMGEIVLTQLVAAGLARIGVTAPVAARAEMTARKLECNYAPMTELSALIERADIVVSALGSGRQAVDAALMEQVLRARKRRPVFLVDAGIPWDIAPEVNDLDGAFLYDIGDLERIAMSGVRHRDNEAALARAIVDQEVAAFLKSQLSRDAAPAVTELRSHFEAVRRSVLAEAGAADAERVTQLLVARLLHAPSENLRQLAEESDADGAAPLERAQALLRRLFGIRGGTTDGKD